MNLLQAKKRVGIGVRLAIMIAVLLVLTTGSFALFSLMSQRRQAMDTFANGSLEMCRSLERILRFSMLENRRSEIESAIKQMAAESSIKKVNLLTHTGTLVYSSDSISSAEVPMTDVSCVGCHTTAASPALKEMPASSHVSIYDERKIAGISLPIYSAPECFNSACHAHSPDESVLGVMQVDVSYADIDESLRKSHTNLMILSLLIALLTSLIVWGLIRNWVSRPVKELLDGTSRVADGDLQHNIPVGEAELGALAVEFNKMQQKILSGQKQLIMIEKLASIGKLAASVAHEINNPMTGILTFAEDLAESAEPDDPRLPDFKLIRDEALRCRQIVGQLLDFSRQDTPILRPTSINQVISKTITFVSKAAFFRDIKVETEYQENLPLVTADPIQLQQVILDVLVNAAEAMPHGGRISIASAVLAETNEIEVSITDTGHGIPEENLEKIFEPFFSTKGGETLGIGLAVSWDIINNHGGSLVVDSRVGEGTTIKIILPERNERVSADKAE